MSDRPMEGDEAGIGIYATSARGGPESVRVFQEGQAHSLGFLDGRKAAQSGGRREPRRHPSEHRPFTDGEWDEYRRGWDEALDAHDMAKVHEYLRTAGAAWADQITAATGVSSEALQAAAARLELSNLYGQYSLPVQTSFDSPDEDD